MTPEEVNDLVQRTSREAAQQAVLALSADGRTEKRALVSINDATTLCAVLATMAGVFLWAVSSMTAPTAALAERNKEDISETTKRMDANFEKINDTMMKILEKLGK